MRTTLAAIAALLAGLAGLGCAPALQIHPYEGADFALHRTWSWSPDAARTIDAPTPYAIGLDRELARLVEASLARRGFEHVERGGDLLVRALLNVRREKRKVVETGAIEQLTSFTSDGSYEIQSSVVRIETFERSRVAILAASPRSGRILWKGALEGRWKGEFTPHLDGLVARLLEHFPSAGTHRPKRNPSAPEVEFTSTPPRAGDPGA